MILPRTVFQKLLVWAVLVGMTVHVSMSYVDEAPFTSTRLILSGIEVSVTDNLYIS